MDHWLGLQTAKAAATQNVAGTEIPLEIGALFANGPFFYTPRGPRGIRFNGAINYR